jgi:hypothetical protein
VHIGATSFYSFTVISLQSIHVFSSLSSCYIHYKNYNIVVCSSYWIHVCLPLVCSSACPTCVIKRNMLYLMLSFLTIRDTILFNENESNLPYYLYSPQSIFTKCTKNMYELWTKIICMNKLRRIVRVIFVPAFWPVKIDAKSLKYKLKVRYLSK